MKDLNRLTTRFRQFGGLRLLLQYARMGILWTVIKECIRCACSNRSFKSIYPAVTKKVDKFLIEEFKTLSPTEHPEPSKVKSKKLNIDSLVWFAWLQGMENAPEMVRICLKSLQAIYGERIVIIDNHNYQEFVDIPEYIKRKYDKGIIPAVLFSDLLRLELLINYGGTWIDSTVMASPSSPDTVWKPSIAEIENSELFLFRYFRNKRCVGISNWFIHAKPHNPLLIELRDSLYAYWKKYDCVVEYYIFHLFFEVIAKKYPEMIKAMPYGNSSHSLLLRDCLDKDFDADWWNKLTTHVCFHKLNYRLEQKARQNRHSYWNTLQFFANSSADAEHKS